MKSIFVFLWLILFVYCSVIVNESNNQWCHCWNGTDLEDNGIECRCFGLSLNKVPKKLPADLEKLTITDAGVKVLKRNSLQPYRSTLSDLTLNNLQQLEVIEAGVFRNVSYLRSLYISQAPILKHLPQIFEGMSSNKFLSLRIMHTGLEELPDLSHLNQNQILHMVDLEDNKLHRLTSNSVRVKAEQLIFNYNEITSVDGFAFKGSQIAKLSFKENKLLSHLNNDAFNGLRSLIELDLSGTSVERLPTRGLEEIEVLRIQGTESLKVVPSVYNFRSLKEAWLTHSFHCCAFKYPAQHDPEQHALHIAQLTKFCQQSPNANIKSKRHIEAFNQGKVLQRNINMDWFDDKHWDLQYDELTDLNSSGFHGSDAIRGEQIENVENADNLLHEQKDFGFFHQTSIEKPGSKSIEAFCGTISQSTPDILCEPKPDALNPCEDIMGSYWLRVFVWFVVITALIGNTSVIIVFFSTLFDITVPKFLMCHLACADICMGLYLLLIASMDLHSMGFYFNFAFDWQMGYGCQIAGFLTVFSSQLSVFTLTLITLERWCAIRYAIYLNRRIRLGAAGKIMIVGWIYSMFMASLPLMGISNYSSTSICLPMEIEDPKDMAYLLTLLLLNSLAFLIIVICYLQIYLSLGKETRNCSSTNEMTIAKKMALLIFTDFACWAPTAFFGITALSGYPLIDVTRSKILLVFFYPLNSCANPYLYAILTAQYRKDFFMLLARCGICKRTIKQYTMSTSLPTNNQSNPLTLLVKSKERKLSKSLNFINEAVV